jgi:hypothetical protein
VIEARRGSRALAALTFLAAPVVLSTGRLLAACALAALGAVFFTLAALGSRGDSR